MFYPNKLFNMWSYSTLVFHSDWLKLCSITNLTFSSESLKHNPSPHRSLSAKLLSTWECASLRLAGTFTGSSPETVDISIRIWDGSIMRWQSFWDFVVMWHVSCFFFSFAYTHYSSKLDNYWIPQNPKILKQRSKNIHLRECPGPPLWQFALPLATYQHLSCKPNFTFKTSAGSILP